MIINVIVAEKNAIAMPHEPLVCGNSDYVIDFKFDAEWDAHPTKTARFIYDDRSYTDVVFTGTQCPVPVLNNTHEVLVGVFAGNLKTTTPAYLRGQRSILCYTGKKAESSQEVYDQIMARVNEVETIAIGAEDTLKDMNGGGELYLINLKIEDDRRMLADRTQAEILAAVNAGKTCIMRDTTNKVYLYSGIEKETPSNEMCPTFYGDVTVDAKHGTAQVKLYVKADGGVTGSGLYVKTPNPKKLTLTGAVDASYDGADAVSVEIPKVPEALPNPHKLSFSGAVNAEYDGGESVSVAIPDVFIIKGTQDENHKSWADRTQAEIRAAVKADKVVLIVDHMGKVFHYVGEYSYDSPEGNSGNVPTFFSDFEYSYGKLSYYRVFVLADGRMSYNGYGEVRTPTPGELTFTGAVEKTFNGSTSFSVDIPDVYIVKATYDEQSVLRSNRTQAQIRAAARAGKTCILVDHVGRVFNYYGERESGVSGTSGNVPTFIAPCEYINGTGIYFWQCQILEDGRAVTNGYKPAKTPNPRALIFTGAVNASYTGSEQVTVNIPTGVTLTVDADGNATI